jgi:toxin ParE1/3/4
MPPVIRTDNAERDLTQILEYLDGHSPKAADEFAKAIDDRCELLQEFPEMGRPREELAPGLRCEPVKGHVLFYRVTESAIEVLRILHSSRDIHTIIKADSPDAE